MRRWCSAVLVLSFASVAGSPEVSNVKVYKGKDGQTVELAALKPVRDKQALLRIKGATADSDGLVIRGTLEDRGQDETDFVTTVHGDSRTLLRVGNGQGTAWPVGGKEFRFKFAEEGSPVLADELVTAHDRADAAGELKLLAKKQFPNIVQKYEAKAAAAMVDLNQVCRSSATFRFQWASFSDDDMANLDAWQLCEPVTRTAKSKCAALEGVTSVTCAMGLKLNVVRNSTDLVFTTTAKGKTEAGAFLAAHLGKP
jgi:hypothetical protein